MNKKKFNKGDLVWANLRGYGVVLAIGQKKPRLTQHPPSPTDYAEIRWQDNLHGYQTKIFRGSIGWEKTHVRARINLNENI